MGWKTKLLVGGLVVGGAALALSGDAAASVRPPWDKPIDPPDTPEEIAAVKQVICTCHRGGATSQRELVPCVLKQVYGDVPWGDLLGSLIDGDHESVRQVIETITGLVVEFLELDTDRARDMWCGQPVDPDNPPPPPTEDPAKKRKELLESLLSDTPVPGGLWRFGKDNPTAVGGTSKTARAALALVGIHDPSNALVVEMMRAFSRGKKWNRLLYGSNAQGELFWEVDGQDVQEAFNPKHDDAVAAVLNGRMPRRNISNTGAKTGPGSSYGVVYVPTFDVDTAKAHGVLVLEEVDPPQELLDLLA